MATTPWASVRPLPKALINPSAAFRNGRLYVTGATNDARKLYVYDEASDTWETRAPLPNPGVIYPFVATRPNQLWLAGGVDPSTNLVTKNLWRYRYEVDDWTKMEPLPAPRHTNGAATDSRTIGRMYVIGGLSKRTRIDASSVRSEMYVYDYETNKWSNRPAMANSRYGHAVGHRAGKLYVIGGRNGANDFATVMRCYDTLRNKWTDLAPPPVNVRQTIAVEGYTKIVLTCVGATRKDTYVYDISTDTWGLADTSGHDGRTKPGAARSADYVYMVGGVDSKGSALNSVMRLPIPDAIDDDFFGQFWPRNKDVAEFGHWEDAPSSGGTVVPAGSNWKTKAPMPAVRRQIVTGVINGKVYVAGGLDASSQPTNTLYCYDPVADSWSTKAPLPSTLYYSIGAGVIDGQFYIAGGYRNGSLSSALTKYNPVTDQWTTLAPMPAAVGEGIDVSTVAGGKLYAIGGYNSSAKNTVYEYNPATNAWTTKTAMPVAMNWIGTCELGGLIYVTAGMVDANNPLTKLYRFDPAANSWTTLADLPEARALSHIVSIGGKIYVIGGKGPGYNDDTYKVLVYDPAKNTWSINTDMTLPHYRNYGTASKIDEATIAVIGGTVDGAVSDTVALSNSTTAFVIGGTSTTAPAVNEDPIPYDSPLVYWKMDDAVGSTSASDYSGNDYNTSLRTDFASTPPTFGAIGVGGTPAVNMTPSGIGLYSQVPVSLWDEFTMEGWFVAKTGGTCTIAGLGVSTTYTTGDGASLSWDGTSTLQFVMNNALVSSTSLAADNAWHHVAVVRSKSAGTVKLYIDGVMKLSTSYSTAMNGSGADLVEAGVHYRHGGANASNPYLTERLAFFDKALTDAQITKHASLLVDPATLPHESPDQIWVPEVLEGQFWPRQSPEVEIGHLEYEDPVYTPLTSAWVTMNTTFPGVQQWSTPVILNGYVYIDQGDSGTDYYRYDPAADTYVKLASSPVAFRARSAAAAIDGKIHYWSYRDLHYIYDPATNTWAAGTAPLSPAYMVCSGVINGKVYATGGSDFVGPQVTTEVYDPATNKWTGGLAPMPGHRSRCGVTTYKDKLYIFGGTYNGSVNGSDYKNETLIYNTTTDKWSYGKPMPIKAIVGAAVRVGTYVYVYANDDSVNALTTIYLYDLVKDTWDTTTPLPKNKRDETWSFNFNDRVYIGGGEGLATAKIYKLAPPTDPTISYGAAWDNSLPALPALRTFLGLANDKGIIYVIGGGTSGGYSSGLQATLYILDTTASAPTWVSKTPAPNVVEGMTGVGIIDGKLYVAGGLGPSQTVADMKNLLCYDIATDSWTRKANMPGIGGGFSGCSNTVLNGKLYASQGNNGAGFYRYDPTTDTWETLANRPSSSDAYCAMVAVNGKIYINGNVNVEEYDPANNSWKTYPGDSDGNGWQAFVAGVGNRMYAISGSNSGGSVTTTFQVWHTDSKTWETVAKPLAQGRRLGGAVAISGMIYLVGGVNDDGTNPATARLSFPLLETAPQPDPILPTARWVSDGVAGLIWP